MTVALGIDFEKITQTPAYRALPDQPAIECDVETIGQRLLSLFDRYNAKATFFIVSSVAQEYPDFIRQIHAEGHEIASHTVSHQSLVDLSTDRLQSEIRDSKRHLESIIGRSISGLRGPTCRINDSIYPLLADSEYEYSSTVMPSVPIPGFYSNDYSFSSMTEIEVPGDSITELPLSVHPFVKLPVSGAWIRLLGRRFLLNSVEMLLARDCPVVTYSHPWEFMSLQDSPLPFRCRVRTGDWLFDTYERLLQLDAEFTTVSAVINQHDSIYSYSITK